MNGEPQVGDRGRKIMGRRSGTWPALLVLVFVLCLCSACSRADAGRDLRAAPATTSTTTSTVGTSPTSMTGSPDSSPSVGENPPPPPEDDAAGSAEPFKIDPIRGAVRREIVGTNWHPGCPVGLDRLRVLTVTYLGFDGDTKVGPLVVHRNVAEEVLGVFRRLLRHDFPIKHIALPPRYRPNLDGYDRTRSVTAGFNCRPVTDGTSWSHHAYGLAVDINPLQNPYVRGDGSTLRRAAQPFRDRGRSAPGMIREGDIVVRSFDRIGWTWGGRWTSIKDYMHFSAVGS